MSIQANKAIAKRYLNAVIEGDIETIRNLQHDDAKWWVLGFGEMDKTTFTGMVEQGLLSATERKLDILALTAEDDRVSVMAQGEMIFPDKVYKNEYHNMLFIRDGLITGGREYMDTMAAAEAFGS